MRRVCKTCRMFVEGNKCPVLRTDNDCACVNESKFTETWKGRLFIFDPEKSTIAKHAGYKQKGEFAIKVR